MNRRVTQRSTMNVMIGMVPASSMITVGLVASPSFLDKIQATHQVDDVQDAVHHADVVGHGRMARHLQRDADETQHHQHHTGHVSHHPVPEYRCVHSSISLASQSVPPAVALDLGVEPGQVGVVGAELLVVLVVLGGADADLDGPDADREIVRVRRPGERALDPSRLIRNSSLIVLAQNTTAKPANSGHSNV